MDRNERIAAMYQQGITMEKIGSQFGITRERVRQILRRYGISAKDGGRAKRVQLFGGTPSEKKKAAARRACEEKYGLPYELFLVLRAEGHALAYRQHKLNAGYRGIPFDLTLGQWWAVWQASGHAHERGRGKGKYCMSRINDSGGYTIGNVHIQSIVNNSRDAVSVWKDKPKKENTGVFLLYPGSKKPYLAKIGKKYLGYFASEEEAAEARTVYAKVHGLNLGTKGVGTGKGWCYLAYRNKSHPYYMQGPGGARSWHATQVEAEAAYRAACEAHLHPAL